MAKFRDLLTEGIKFERDRPYTIVSLDENEREVDRVEARFKRECVGRESGYKGKPGFCFEHIGGINKGQKLFVAQELLDRNFIRILS